MDKLGHNKRINFTADRKLIKFPRFRFYKEHEYAGDRKFIKYKIELVAWCDWFVDSAVLLSKYRLKCAVFIHVLLVFLMAFRLSVALYVMIGIRPPRTLQKFRFPAAKNWELVWLLGSAVTCLVGIVALLRNRPTLVRFYAAGQSFQTISDVGGLRYEPVA